MKAQRSAVDARGGRRDPPGPAGADRAAHRSAADTVHPWSLDLERGRVDTTFPVAELGAAVHELRAWLGLFDPLERRVLLRLGRRWLGTGRGFALRLAPIGWLERGRAWSIEVDDQPDPRRTAMCGRIGVLDLTPPLALDTDPRASIEVPQALVSLLVELLESADEPRLLDRVLDLILDASSAPIGRVVRWHAEDGVFEVVAQKGTSQVRLGQRLMPQDSVLGRAVFGCRAPIVVDDFSLWARARCARVGVPLGPVANLPLVAGATVIGVLGVARPAGAQRFSAQELRALMLWARLCAVIMHRADLAAAHRASLAERQAMEAEMADHLSWLQIVSATLPNCVFWRRVKRAERIGFAFVGPGITELTGLSTDRILADPNALAPFYSQPYRAELRDYERRSAETGERLDRVLPFIDRHGAERWVRLIAAPRRRGPEEIVWDGFFMDVTEERQRSVERDALIATLQQRNLDLDRYNASVAHDLRNPVLSIRSTVDLALLDLERGKVERVGDRLRQIERTTEQMIRLIDHLLELARLGRTAVQPQWVSVADLVTEVAERVDTELRRSQAEFDARRCRGRIWADPELLREALLNLVGNAIKFAKPGQRPRIEVGCVREEGTTGAKRYVCDQGVGIPPAYHERVFEPFERLTRSVPGFGIGLSLVRQIAEVHGGRVWVESAGEGEGACFVLYFPDPADGGTP